MNYTVTKIKRDISVESLQRKLNSIDEYCLSEALTGFPVEIVRRMLEHQVFQGNEFDIELFRVRGWEENKKLFIWDKTSEGYDFWYEIITKRNFKLFFDYYSKDEDPFHRKCMKVTKEDLIGDLKEFPLQVVSKMVENQFEQGNVPNVYIFTTNACSQKVDKGFDWAQTIEGYFFWEPIIRNKNFELFFKRFK